jgi:hypothetical protein
MLLGTGAFLAVALLSALQAADDAGNGKVDFAAAVWRVARPAGIDDWVQLAGIAAFALIGGLFVAAWVAARQGMAHARAVD